MNRRSSGILLHLSSLPGPFGIGDMGPRAYRFADFLAQTGQSYWQMLPLNPTDPDHYNSPYHSTSAFAGNPLLISPALLVEEGLLTETDVDDPPVLSEDRVDFSGVSTYKQRLFDQAYQRFKTGTNKAKFAEFCRRNGYWLEDFVLFNALKSRYGRLSWNLWPEEIRDRHPDALQAVRTELQDPIDRQKFLQFVFFRQWRTLKNYCRQKGVQIFGDIPIYMHYDSADVWVHPDIFKLDAGKKPYVVSGVPPDYFSETGQLWGHPVYRWDALQNRNYDWWIHRIHHNLKLFDIVRIDHFRGLVAFWEVPAQEKTAINGRWVQAPVDDFFHRLLKSFACLPIIAEDLGTITSDVREIMQRYNLPGMRLLLFAFGGDFPTSSFLPHNHVKNCVIYTGTHDNNTVRGWFEKEAADRDKDNLFRYLGREVPIEELHWEMVRWVMMSVADMAIIPVQDLLGLGAEARMNNPAELEGNWHWRLADDPMTPALIKGLLEMTTIYGRA
jgi:4-alpha-glucanotransferase